MTKKPIFLLLGLLFLESCYAATPYHGLEQDPEKTPVIIADYLSKCLATGTPCEESVSFPFYADSQALSKAEYLKEFPQDSSASPVPDFELNYVILPMSHLSVFWPKVWQDLKDNPTFKKESRRLALVAVNIKVKERYEKGWLILRHDNGAGIYKTWKIAGLIDG